MQKYNSACCLYGFESWSLTLREVHALRMLENRMLRRIFGPKRDEGSMEWIKLYKEELNDLYSSPNVVRVVKSRNMRWSGRVAGMRDSGGVYRALVGNLRERGHLEDPGVDGRIILR